MDRLSDLFGLVSGSRTCTASELRERILACGIQFDDLRVQQTWRALAEHGDRAIDLDAFVRIVGPELLMIDRILNRRLIIPDWADFEQDIRFIYDRVEADRSGANAD